MGDINYGRVIIAGLVAGLVINVIGYVAFGLILADTMAEAFAPLGVAEPGVTQIALFGSSASSTASSWPGSTPPSAPGSGLGRPPR